MCKNMPHAVVGLEFAYPRNHHRQTFVTFSTGKSKRPEMRQVRRALTNADIEFKKIVGKYLLACY